jgi:hypothetical protein
MLPPHLILQSTFILHDESSVVAVWDEKVDDVKELE